MARELVYTRFWVKNGRINTKNVYEDSPEYWLPYLVITLLFVAVLVGSGYFFFRQPFADRLEYLVGPLTIFTASLTAVDGKTIIFMPAFVIGCIWGILSLFTDISFNLAAYIFCYCCSVVLMFFIQLLNS